MAKVGRSFGKDGETDGEFLEWQQIQSGIRESRSMAKRVKKNPQLAKKTAAGHKDKMLESDKDDDFVMEDGGYDVEDGEFEDKGNAEDECADDE